MNGGIIHTLIFYVVFCCSAIEFMMGRNMRV